MLKFIVLYNNKKIAIYNLNTSHVKVYPNTLRLQTVLLLDLNTSHVKVYHA